MRRTFLTSLGLILLALAEPTHGERWQSPDRFYSLTVPFDWKRSENKGETTTSYAFMSRDGGAEIRISATYDLVRLPEQTPDTILDSAFPDEQPTIAKKRIRGKGWDGIRREYTNARKDKRWLGVAARRGTTIVLLTMQAPSNQFEEFRPIFESAAQSLQLGEN